MSGNISVDEFYSRVQDLVLAGEAGGLSSDDMSNVFGQAVRELQVESLPPPVASVPVEPLSTHLIQTEANA